MNENNNEVNNTVNNNILQEVQPETLQVDPVQPVDGEMAGEQQTIQQVQQIPLQSTSSSQPQVVKVVNSKEVVKKVNKGKDQKSSQPKQEPAREQIVQSPPQQSVVVEKPKKKYTGLYVLITILCVLILSLGGYFVYDKTQSNKTNTADTTNNSSNSTNTNTNTTDTTNNTLNSTNTNSLVSKLDNSKDWVYDAEYTKNVTADSYSTYYETYYAKDIIVPYINVNSSYANTANSDIKKVFDDAIKNYNDGVSNKMTYVDECSYKKYVTDNSLSVILTYGVGATDVVHPNYYTYNINLKTGNQLSYEEVYNIAGLSSSNIDSKVENAITKIMQEELKDLKDHQKDTGDGSYYPVGTNFDTYNNKSISNYKKSVSNNTLIYFLSENGKLNIVVTLSIPAGDGEFDTIITVD